MSDPILDTAREMLRVCDKDRVAAKNPQDSSVIVRYDTLCAVCRALIVRTEALRELVDAEHGWANYGDVLEPHAKVWERFDAARRAARAALGDGAAEREDA